MTFRENIKIGCYAGSGVGKTVGIGSLIDAYGAERVHIISCERGLNTIASKLRDDQVTVVDDLSEFQDALVKYASDESLTVNDWVCVDGGSRVLQWLEADVFGRAERCLQERIQGTQRSSDPEYAVYVTGSNAIDIRRLYAKLADRAERMFNRFVKLKASHYWTFWERQPYIDANTKSPTWTVDAPSGPRTAAVATMDYVYRLTRDRESGKLVSKHRNDLVSFAKNRDDRSAGVVVPDQIVDFDLADFCERVRGKGWPTTAK
jgi:hypothetical protein